MYKFEYLMNEYYTYRRNHALKCALLEFPSVVHLLSCFLCDEDTNWSQTGSSKINECISTL